VKLATPVRQVSLTRTLASDLETLQQDLLLRSSARPLDATPSLSKADSLVSGLLSLTPSAVEQGSALNASNYMFVPHNCLPVNKVDNSPVQDMFSMAHRTVPGSRGHFWFLQVRINYLPNQDSITTMLRVLSALMDILPNAINRFELHPLEEASTLPALINNKVEEGFPGSAVLDFKYFLERDRRNVKGKQAASRSAPSPHRYNDEENYKPSIAMWGVIWVKGNSNMKEACDALAWDMIDLGLTVRWKKHQSVESSMHILLMNVPPVLECGSVKSEIVWHLCELEKRFLKKEILPEEYVGIPLPKISVLWRQSKQGKGKSEAEHDLSLNLLGQPFQENGCLVCTLEAAEGSWKHLGPMWEAFHKMGLCRHALGHSCCMIVMFNGRSTNSDQVAMQRLCRVNVMYLFMLSHTQIPTFLLFISKSRWIWRMGVSLYTSSLTIVESLCCSLQGQQRASRSCSCLMW
jgi:hypothetical protein